ncbi:MAG: extracellular solute-binding protein [Phycisphaerales bacterium]|jgi:iron(III) transport system substrate-binding protein|nr:extracellular solute-binding protein [Phycisphaerales bacterium]
MAARLKVAISFLCVIFLISCGSNETPKVTVYVSADEQIARTVFNLFTERTGIEVLWVGDTESSKTTALVQRLIREKTNPVADVFWSSEIIGTINLADEDVLTSYTSEVAEKWPTNNRDDKYRWFGFSPRARVIAYDPTRTKTTDLPSMWWEYDQAAMADPRFGTTGTHLAVMSTFPEQYDKFTNKVKGNYLLGGNAATVRAVVNGLVEFAMTDTDDVHAAKENGASIEMYYPRHHEGEGGGTLLIPNTVAIINGCNHPDLAGTFVDFMLSDEVAIVLARSPSHNIPLQGHLAKQFPELVVEDPLVIDFAKAAEMHKKIMPSIIDTLLGSNEK